MPLYQHTKSGERVRTVAGSSEDGRLRAADSWKAVEGAKPADGAKGDARTGRGVAKVNLTGGGE